MRSSAVHSFWLASLVLAMGCNPSGPLPAKDAGDPETGQLAPGGFEWR